MPTGTRQSRSPAVGVLLIALLAGATAATIFIDDIAHALTPHYSFVIALDEAHGIEPGSPVWLAGRPVGQVLEVDLIPPDRGTAPVMATVELRAEVRDRVRHDGEIRLGTTGVMGDRVIRIEPGSIEAPPVDSGDTVSARPTVHAKPILERVHEVRTALDSLLAEAHALRSTAAAREPSARELLHRLASIRTALGQVLDDLETSPLVAFLEAPSGHGRLLSLYDDLEEIDRLIGLRAQMIQDSPPGAALDGLAERTDELGSRLLALRALLDESPGLYARWTEDSALRDAIEATRIQLDSLIEETVRRPWRYFF